VVDALLRLFLRVPSTGGFEIRTANASLTEFFFAPSGLWQMIRYNDSAHLAGLPIETDRASL
jgi:probable phosphoglycerate mutase